MPECQFSKHSLSHLSFTLYVCTSMHTGLLTCELFIFNVISDTMVPMHLAVFNVLIFMTILADRHVFLSYITERNLCAFFQSRRGRLWWNWHRCWRGTHLPILLPFSSNNLVGDLGTFNFCAFKIWITVSVCRGSSHFTGTCHLMSHTQWDFCELLSYV